MSISISIIGASGAVGSTLATHILRSDLLGANDRLQLVGRGVPASTARLLATRTDLLDAFDQERVDIEVVPEIEDVDGDIVVVCAGGTISAKAMDRRLLGSANLPIFEQIADACAAHVPGSIFIVVSNPVELAVQVLSSRLGRHRVFGMGAQQDSLRFARAIAKDLGISRHDIRASVLGEHGQAMVPLWSTVELKFMDPALHGVLSQLKDLSAASPLMDRVIALQKQVAELLLAEEIAEAYEAARKALPDARIMVEPMITGHTMHSTPNATANATLHCLAATIRNHHVRVHGQVSLQGESLGLEGICGVPIHLTRAGWTAAPLPRLTADERMHVESSARSIDNYLRSVYSHPDQAIALS
ncbi:lactate/malate family dehydrogenase [Silvibacterium acidisoli]|uniref:lactate/malate family dehydrogenase n=1 Tax=Acidobacteriaceae bacterium ZG23-2 TaxID=2883246 RepID=UPI00406D3B42